MKTTYSLLCGFTLFCTLHAQNITPSSFLWGTSVPINITKIQSFDMHTNELGINVAYDSDGYLKYVLIGLNGRVIREATIVGGYSLGWLVPAITSLKNGTREDIFIFYRHQDSVRVAISTNSGNTWLHGSSVWAKDDTPSNRMDACSKATSVHVTWDTQEDEYTEVGEVHYARLDYSVQPAIWSDEYTSTLGSRHGIDENGREPQILVAPNDSLYLVYITRKLENGSYDRVVHRTKYHSSTSWGEIDIVVRLQPDKETCNTVTGSRHYSNEYFPVAIASSSSHLFCALNMHNTQPRTSNPTCSPDLDFYYTEILKDLYTSPPDTSQTSNIGSYNSYLSRDRSICWSEDSLFHCYFGNDSLHLSKSSGNETFTQSWAISNAEYPYLSTAEGSKLLGLWTAASSIHGYRIPRDIDTSIYVTTFFTGKSRIKSKATISLESNVTATVYDTLILADSSHLSLKQGSKLLLKSSGRVYVSNGASLDLQGGTIEFEGSTDSALFVMDSAGSRGKGTIINPRIYFKSGFTLYTNDSLGFQSGGKLTFNCDPTYQPQRMEVFGNLVFSGIGSTYQFGECLDTILVETGWLRTTAGVTLLHLPDLVNWQYGDLYSEGAASDSCRWLFRNNANCDVYGTITATKTKFIGSPLDSLPRWNGIFVSMPSSFIKLDSCYIKDINVVQNYGGSAIHLYESGSQQNRVANTKIVRYAGQGEIKEGDGIFLQPHTSGSYLKIVCSDIFQDWWTGLSTAFSGFGLSTSKIYQNRVGIFAHNFSAGTLDNNGIEYHLDKGIHNYNSTIWLAEDYSGLPGDNRIVGNDSVQLLGNHFAWFFGQSRDSSTLGNNNISHISGFVPRVIVDTFSVAEVTRNWWGGSLDSVDINGNWWYSFSTLSRFFISRFASSIEYSPYLKSVVHQTCAIDCDPEGGFGKLNGNAPMIASRFSQLRGFAQRGNFYEVYRFLNSRMIQPQRSSIAALAASIALQIESDHARLHPDSAQRSAVRL